MHRFGGICLLVAASFAATAARGQDQSQFIRTKTGSGSLVEKLIVTEHNAFYVKSLAAAETRLPVPSFSIYFRLRTGTAGDETSGYYRIGDSQGAEIGWIKKEFVTSWNTRFGLEPVAGDTTKHFTIYKDPSLATPYLEFVGAEGQLPVGARRYALIRGDAGDEETFDVAVFTGAVESGGARQREQMAIYNLELEIVFVVASTYSMTNMVDAVREVVRNTSAELRKNQDLQPLIHFGLVEYRDAPPQNEFAARVRCRLTEDFSKFQSELAELSTPNTTQSHKDDWPDDVIAGLDAALNDVGWRANSSKHIIVLGDCPAKDGFDAASEKTFRSFANKSLEDILREARPSSGSAAAQTLAARSFHAVTNQHPEVIEEALAGELKDLDDEAKNALRKLVRDPQIIAAVREDADGVAISIAETVGKEAAVAIVTLILQNEGRNLSSKQLERQFRQLAANDDELEGLFLAIDTNQTPGDKDRAVRELVAVLRKAFDALEVAREGNIEAFADDVGNIGNSIYQIVGTQGSDEKLGDVQSGYASVRDENGRLIAKKTVMVFEDELEHLRSLFFILHRRFEKKSDKAARQNVADILDELKDAVASEVSGQELDEETDLAKVIELDFPLKTPALEISARELAVMTTPAFEDWLSSLKSAHDRIDATLDGGEQQWTTLSAEDRSRYMFLDLSELP